MDDGELLEPELEPEPVVLEPELLLPLIEPVPLVEEPEPYPLLLGLAFEFVLLEPEDEDGVAESAPLLDEDGVAESAPLLDEDGDAESVVLDVPVELPVRLRRERVVVVVVLELLFWSTLVPDWPVCDAVGAVGSLGLPAAAGGELDGMVDCDEEEDDCAYAPVARIVHSASEPIPSTFVVELM